MNRIYLDNHATTIIDDRVVEAMQPVLADCYGNPSSIHGPGRQARKALDQARRAVALALGAREREVVFTAGGTEANNLAIRGAYALCAAQGRRRVITSAVEHPSVRSTVADLPGVERVELPVDGNGSLSVASLAEALEQPTGLVTLMAANNETGVRFPVDEIAEHCARAGALFHCDAVQAFGKGPLPIEADLISVSAHKIHGPKGIGALRIKKGLDLPPLHSGGHQERGRRGGTENMIGAVGFGRAAELLGDQLACLEQIASRRDRLESELCRSLGARANGAGANRVATVSNLHLPGLEGEAMVIALDMEGIALSSGSACSSGTMEPSHVLLAMGLDYDHAGSSLRFSLSRQTTDQEIDEVLQRVPRVAERLRTLGL